MVMAVLSVNFRAAFIAYINKRHRCLLLLYCCLGLFDTDISYAAWCHVAPIRGTPLVCRVPLAVENLQHDGALSSGAEPHNATAVEAIHCMALPQDLVPHAEPVKADYHKILSKRRRANLFFLGRIEQGLVENTERVHGLVQ